MSKYPVQYQSSSKGLVNIEDMPTPHLMNAWRRIDTAMNYNENVGEEHVRIRDCMVEELTARGCTYDDATGRWDLPPKQEEVDL